jgi:hypothetical protein
MATSKMQRRKPGEQSVSSGTDKIVTKSGALGCQPEKHGFIDFSYFIGTGMTLKHSDGGVEGNLDTRVLMLIAPFLVGFSTSLVIVILDRLMVCAKMLFGQGPSVARELEPTGRQQPIAEIGSRSSPEPKPLS